MDHLHLFFGVPVILEYIDVGEQIESDLGGKHFLLHRFIICPGPQLLFEFLHRTGACAGNGLIGGNHNTLDVSCTMDWVQSYHHLDRRTVGIGNQSLMLKCLFRINLRNHQGDLFIHPESTAVIDHHRTGIHCMGCEFLTPRASCREESDINPFKGFRGQFLNFQVLTPELQFGSRRS